MKRGEDVVKVHRQHEDLWGHTIHKTQWFPVVLEPPKRKRHERGKGSSKRVLEELD